MCTRISTRTNSISVSLAIVCYFYVNRCASNVHDPHFLSIYSFHATGDHLPVPPPAPAHARFAAEAAQQQQQFQPKNFDLGSSDYDDGQYDPRYNDPNFVGNQRSAPIHVPNSPAPALPSPAFTQQPAQQNFAPAQPFNDVNNVNYVAQYRSTTPNPHRFQPPGKLSLSRTHDGFSYSFNKI